MAKAAKSNPFAFAVGATPAGDGDGDGSEGEEGLPRQRSDGGAKADAALLNPALEVWPFMRVASHVCAQCGTLKAQGAGVFVLRWSNEYSRLRACGAARRRQQGGWTGRRVDGWVAAGCLAMGAQVASAGGRSRMRV